MTRLDAIIADLAAARYGEDWYRAADILMNVACEACVHDSVADCRTGNCHQCMQRYLKTRISDKYLKGDKK